MLPRNSLRPILCCSALIVLIATSVSVAQDAGAGADAEWKMTITHHGVFESQPHVPASALTYQQAYEMIPFSRTEYDANPSYRHDAAMELLFNQMRPTTIIRSQTSRSAKHSTVKHPGDFYYGRGYYGANRVRYPYRY